MRTGALAGLSLLMVLFLLAGCEVEIPEDEYVAYYEKECGTEVVRSGIHFRAIPLSPDYEKVKWGSPLDSGMRVVLGAFPRSDLSFEDAFLTRGDDTLHVVVKNKMQTFEIGAADMFVLGFAERVRKAKLYLRNVGRGIGGVEIELKDCSNIRVEETR